MRRLAFWRKGAPPKFLRMDLVPRYPDGQAQALEPNESSGCCVAPDGYAPQSLQGGTAAQEETSLSDKCNYVTGDL